MEASENLIWTVSVNEDGTYRISQNDRFLSMGTEDAGILLDDVNQDWIIEAHGDGYSIKNAGRESYLMWKADENCFVTDAAIDDSGAFDFLFYQPETVTAEEPAAEPTEPVEEPAEDTIEPAEETEPEETEELNEGTTPEDPKQEGEPDEPADAEEPEDPSDRTPADDPDEYTNDNVSEDVRGIHNYITIDTDPAGGYTGDYVVIYNPSTSYSTSYSTGNMSGLIQTTVSADLNANPDGQEETGTEITMHKIDVGPKLRKEAASLGFGSLPEPVKATSYYAGDTKVFKVYQGYSPTGSASITFKCLYVGSHCYIWTPVSSSSNTYPLDTIDTSYAKTAANEFDSKYDLMQSSFGTHTTSTSGDGKIHILYYNIVDENNSPSGYTAGFFWEGDLYYNDSLPMLNIDTYPGVYYKYSDGSEIKSLDSTYGTMVHEYQHLIFYSNTLDIDDDADTTWINESFSAAAEEICYPGSSVVGRIQQWENKYYSGSSWLNPPEEIEYTSSFDLHNDFSMYNWDNGLLIRDLLALYGQVSLFAQYLFTRFGNTI